MMQQGRQALVALTAKHPHAARAWRELEELFTKEGWTEERCDALKSEEAAYPAWLRLQGALARCEQALGFSRKAEERYLEVLSELPYDGEYINALLGLVEQRRDYAASAALLESRLKVYPFESTTWERLAEVRRKAGDPDGTREALERAIALDPDSPNAHAELAHLAMQRGDRASAVGEFREALTRNPANESVANRLDFLAPTAKEVWEADVPSEAAIDEAVQSRRKLKAEPGANLAYIIDAEVTELKPDGSTSGVVTHVIHAFNQQGRDGLLRQHLQPGRTRILHAYAVDPAGQRVEPSSIRGPEVFFRGLEVGSTVVLQYRRDVPPTTYLAKHLAEEWWFQSANAQSSHSQLVLWRPSSQKLHEKLFGPVKREEKTVGDRTRVSWTYDAAPAVTMEPAGPSAQEVLANLRISTVPDWDVFLSWEDALLQDAFRPSPELDAAAKRILEGAKSPAEKLERIHAYLMDEIRYQQDYENPIAGVRPHPASTVLERRYGDCKDKAVTFMTLARMAGLKAEYALVRTRQLGQVDVDVPMQQFNHAIVYVPPQPGLSAGRFFDATADALDVDAVPMSDVGTQSLVYDPLTHQHEWKAIEYQPPGENSYQLDTVLTLKADGSATGESTIAGRGMVGSWLRVSSRNEQQFKQVLQQTFNTSFPGARVGDEEVADAKDVLHPLKIKVRFEVPGAARLEDGRLRMKLVPDWNPQAMFALEHRTMALVYGAPYELRANVDIHLPEGARVASTPSSGPVDIDCLKVDRRIEASGGVVKAKQQVRVTCERTEVKDYPAARERSDAFRKRVDE
jgi:tetratricopeptide (TPR) repeat protein